MTNTPMNNEARRKRIVWMTLGGSALASAAVGFGIGLSEARGASTSWAAIAFVPVMALACAATWFYWRALDELARRVHEQSFYWGGSVAIGICALWGFAALSQADWLPGAGLIPDSGPEAFGAGMLTAVFMVIACYAIGWTWVWLRKR